MKYTFIQSGLKKLRDSLNRSIGYGIENNEQLLQACIEAKNINKKTDIKYNTLTMIEAVIQTDRLQARDIMIPRTKMVVIDKNISQEDLLKVLHKNPHSRFPIVSNDQYRVTGILLAKDVLNYYYIAKNPPKFNLRRLSRPVKVIPESKRLTVLLKEFRNHRNHMAIVINEFGQTTGFVTIEDVLEQIVGDILDEHDNNIEQYYLQHKDDLWTIKPTMPLKQLIDKLNLNIDHTRVQSNTVGGWLIEHTGYLPKQFEKITIDSLQFRILRADQQKIRLLELTLNPETDEQPNNTNDKKPL